ncbi:dolichyl-phosphate-mannose--protein mannosyltransferase [Phycicoccus flavus]|uniref:dolichyl-phosphate-mannose--protein mannosyltransferase n=1 Tax=Phycicoccus flavus TaxID=2502783 RepID=UPI000FEB6AB3|nr:phospholipid carrier-dependent glycosyltransferase [Phycicoccus flavus]NHA67612.1 phospholipid carrier-dependent glycosyltransferase [Phycicoccus flavus]
MTRTDELRARLLGHRPTDVLWGWLGPGLIALVGGLLRFWDLGRPQALVFDETYYVKQGYSMIRYGVEMHTLRSLKTPDVPFAQGTPDVFSSTEGDYVVHPPVGKWVIGAGEWVIGADNGWGWRFSVALVGTLSILVVGRVARRMFGSTALGCVASFLLAFEGLHFVMSRTGILDIIVMFFALCAFAALLIDRDRSRATLAAKVGALGRGEWPEGVGPWLGPRPWRWVAGVSLGLCTGTKISGLFFLAAFGLLTVWWDLGARRAAGVRHWLRGTAVLDAPFAVVQTVLTAAGVYLVSWTGWFLSDTGYNRQWAQDNPGEGVQWLPPALRSLVDYHRQQFGFNTTLAEPHPYMSNPWSWLVQTRPTSFYYESPTQGVDGCTVAQCSQAINPIGTVTMWWVGVLALLVVLWWWVVRRDWRAGAIVAGMVGGYLPWFAFQGRTIFTFYAVAFEPWVVLAVTMAVGLFVGQRAADPARWRVRVLVVGGYLLLTLAVFAFFHPVYVADTIPYDHWRWRMWFPSWI